MKNTLILAKIYEQPYIFAYIINPTLEYELLDHIRRHHCYGLECDFAEAWKMTASGADDPNVDWFDPRAHGTVSQRVEAFEAGYYAGLLACFDYTPLPR